jgi:hypothetical protein
MLRRRRIARTATLLQLMLIRNRAWALSSAEPLFVPLIKSAKPASDFLLSLCSIPSSQSCQFYPWPDGLGYIRMLQGPLTGSDRFAFDGPENIPMHRALTNPCRSASGVSGCNQKLQNFFRYFEQTSVPCSA